MGAQMCTMRGAGVPCGHGKLYLTIADAAFFRLGPRTSPSAVAAVVTTVMSALCECKTLKSIELSQSSGQEAGGSGEGTRVARSPHRHVAAVAFGQFPELAGSKELSDDRLRRLHRAQGKRWAVSRNKKPTLGEQRSAKEAPKKTKQQTTLADLIKRQMQHARQAQEAGALNALHAGRQLHVVLARVGASQRFHAHLQRGGPSVVGERRATSGRRRSAPCHPHLEEVAPQKGENVVVAKLERLVALVLCKDAFKGVCRHFRNVPVRVVHGAEPIAVAWWRMR